MNDAMLYDKTLIDSCTFEKWLKWLSEDEKRFLDSKLKTDLSNFINSKTNIQKRIMEKCMKYIKDFRVNKFVVNDIFHLNNSPCFCSGKCEKKLWEEYDDSGWDEEYMNPKYWN